MSTSGDSCHHDYHRCHSMLLLTPLHFGTKAKTIMTTYSLNNILPLFNLSFQFCFPAMYFDFFRTLFNDSKIISSNDKIKQTFQIGFRATYGNESV